MRFLSHLVSLVASVTISIPSVSAYSRARNPLNYLTVVDNALIETPSHHTHVHAYSSFDLSFDLHKKSQHIRLSLKPNHDILGDDAHVTYLAPDGTVSHSEKIVREDHKVYQGKAWVVDRRNTGESVQVGWARIVVRRDGAHPLFQGVFTIFGDHHHILMKSNYIATKQEWDPKVDSSSEESMIVFRDSDISQTPINSELKRGVGFESNLACSADKLEFNTNPNHPIFHSESKRDTGFWGAASFSSLLGKRQSIDGGSPASGNTGGVNLASTIGNSAGCPTTRKVALIGVATDCSYTGVFSDHAAVQQNVITQVNSASELYQSTFNITLALQNLTISNQECPSTAPAATPWNLGCVANTTITDRLNLFSQWRGNNPDNNAYWSLFSTCNTEAEVGLAWLGQLCNAASTPQTDTSGTTQYVTGANVVVRTDTEWQVFAHESGHTFGAVHDCDSTTCSDGTSVKSQQCCPLSQSTCDANAQYIMNPYSTPGVDTFSACTLGNICSALGRNSVKSACLVDNKGVVTLSGAKCGNGIVEAGEDCDCGGTAGCGNNTCCDANTCKFKPNSVCDPSNEGCCSSSCQFSSASTVCRASTGSCDPQEVCSGTNGTCPADQTAKDGTSCGSGLQCASGQCTSRDQQCKTLMGSYTSNNDTYACNSQTCTLSCASPEFGPNTCYSLQQNFLDGTDCSGGGHCNNGVCQGATVGGEVKSWIDDNKTLVIALASAIGGLLLLSILGCIVRRFRRPRGGKGNLPAGRNRRYATGRPSYVQNGGWDGPMPPQMQQRGGWSSPPPLGNPGWAGPAYYRPPPPAYGAGGLPPGRSSVRYA
jgi:hypothetical protein